MKFYFENNTTKPVSVSDSDFDQFKTRFKQLIREHWMNKYYFKRNNVSIEPEFKMKFLDVAGCKSKCRN